MKFLLILFLFFFAASCAWFLPLHWRRWARQLSLWWLSLFVGFLGFHFLFTWTAARIIPAIQSERWPTVSGQMNYVGVKIKTSFNKKLHIPVQQFVPEVRYEYSVGGLHYVGHNVMYEQEGVPFTTREEAFLTLKGVKPDDTVTVYYDPKTPEQSCLTPGFHEDMFIQVIFISVGLICLVISFACVNSKTECNRYVLNVQSRKALH